VESSQYHSPLREEQKEATRRRILQGLVRVMADGPAAVSIPAVAAEAEVSVPTVYRHFGDKAGLMQALAPFMGAQLGLDDLPEPESPAEVEDFVRALFTKLDQADPVVRAALASGAAPEARRASAEMRVTAIRDLFRDHVPGMDVADLDRLARVLVILTCSDALRLWQDRFDVDADEVADHVIWAIHALLSGLRA
jgi:AcrR family transcriptional regulator